MGDDDAKPDDLEARLARLNRDIGKADGKNAEARATMDTDESEAMLRARSVGFRILGEFVAAIIAGVLIGFVIDRAAGTSPAFLIIFLILGTVAGFWNIYRAAAPQGGSGGAKPRG